MQWIVVQFSPEPSVSKTTPSTACFVSNHWMRKSLAAFPACGYFWQHRHYLGSWVRRGVLSLNLHKIWILWVFGSTFGVATRVVLLELLKVKIYLKALHLSVFFKPAAKVSSLCSKDRESTTVGKLNLPIRWTMRNMERNRQHHLVRQMKWSSREKLGEWLLSSSSKLPYR